MRSFLKIFNRLIPVQSDKRTPELQNSDVQFTSSCAKAKKTLCNANRRRRRWRWSRDQPTPGPRSHRSITHAAPSFHREYADASLRNSIPAEGTRRAPVLGNVQPPRSPLPPFEESVRSFTRRTPGSEDAASVETEVGYPVVGPVTPRTGHQNLRSTLFHQNEIIFSQDVSTNTPYTNIPLIRTFSDGLPSTQGINVEGNTGWVSTASQTHQAEAFLGLWLPEMPMSATTEQQDALQSIANPQEGQPTTTQTPTIGTELSPFRPLAHAAEANQPSSPQTGQLPKNFYFPSQMRRNRSNTDDSNCPGHRKIVPACTDIDINDPFCSKMGRSCPRSGRLGSPDRRDSEIRAEDPPVGSTIQSMQCCGRGHCKLKTAQISTSGTQKPLLNAKFSVPWPEIPDNASVTHSQESDLQNRLLPGPSIQSCLATKSSENIGSHRILQQPYTEKEGFQGEMNVLGRCLKSASDSQATSPTRAVIPPEQTADPQALDSEKHVLKMDRGTQSILQADSPVHNVTPQNCSTPFATISDKPNFNQRPDPLHPSVGTFRKLLSEDDPGEKPCILQEAKSRHSSQENDVQGESINQASALGFSTILPPSSVGRSPNDQPTQQVPDFSEKHESGSGAEESHRPPIIRVGNSHSSNKVPETPPTNMPLVLVTVPETESKASTEEHDSVGSIDIRNHLFVKNASEVSVASSVYIGEDGKAAVTRNNLTLDTSSSRGTPDGSYSQRRELGTKPKIREPLSLRKKMLAINDDSLVKDRSSAIDDGRNLVSRGHRVIGERTRAWTRNQISSRKNNFGDPHRSPGRCPRSMDSKRPLDTPRRHSGQPVGELRSIWINPQTERSFPSSNSTIDIPADFSQAILLSHPPKSPTTPTSRPPSRSPNRAAGIGAEANKFMVECISCKAKLEAPIRQCIEGHGFCAKCSSQGDCCPICRSSVPESNKMRDLIRNIRFACKNSLAGCRETYGMEDHSKHESRCLYRQRACPLANRSAIKCTWKGARSGIRGHMKKHHGHSGTIHPLRTFFPVEAFDTKLWVDRAYDVEILFVENEIFELHKVFDTRKTCVWGLLRRIVAKDVSQRYIYSIRFQPKNIRGSLTFNIEALEGSEELNKAFEMGKRFKFYLDSLSQEPLEVFSIHLRVVPRSATMFHNVL